MHVLVINCGSSSIKADVIEPESDACADPAVQRIGSAECTADINGALHKLAGADHETALRATLPNWTCPIYNASVIGSYAAVPASQSRTSDLRQYQELEQLSPLAPLHSLQAAGIRVAIDILENRPQVAVFDTFHDPSRRAQQYALPQPLVAKHGFKRYGFHGTSHQWVAERAATWLAADLVRLVTCHFEMVPASVPLSTGVPWKRAWE